MSSADLTNTTDEQVIEQVLSGDRGAYEVLVRRYNRRVYRAVRGILRNDDEAEDVMQDAYVRAYQHLAGFEPIFFGRRQNGVVLFQRTQELLLCRPGCAAPQLG